MDASEHSRQIRAFVHEFNILFIAIGGRCELLVEQMPAVGQARVDVMAIAEANEPATALAARLRAHAVDFARATQRMTLDADTASARQVRPGRYVELADALHAAVNAAVAPNLPAARVTATPDACEIPARLSGDSELLADIGRLFIEPCPTVVGAREGTSTSGHAAALAGADAIKHSVGNVSDHRAFQLAHGVERRGRRGRAAAVSAIVPELVEELGCACAAREAVVTEGVQV